MHPMKIRATIKNGEGDLRLLIGHPMETGQRKDSAGNVIPAHFIQTLTIAINGKVLVDGELGTAVSRNPVFAFLIEEAKAGDKVHIEWADNKGEKGSGDAEFA